ncbi:hypothetical protein E3U55_08385 [Filobacillus milosensis]|uniref:Uncharacterized protein n=1 Tax=Filobacillus milosensis TaxID=94137 RepID=A0A4Y8INM6_9BACI|nr:hypothetical protein [Filobacillus milosensis]TFB21829.1 hypothetical protein E3U55_08385 [Filobacillus milosensis]
MKRILFYGLIGSILIWGSYQIVFSENEDVTAEQDDTKPRVTQNIEELVKQAIQNYNQLKEQHETLDINNETIQISDPEVKNWIIHTYIQSAVYKNVNLEGIALVDQAMQYKHTNNAIINWAKARHDTTVSDEEINNYIQKQLVHIENGEQSHPFFKKISEALNLTEAEYFYEWEYNRFAQLLLQDKLFVKYQRNNPKLEDETEAEYQRRIIQLMENDLTEYRKQ